MTAAPEVRFVLHRPRNAQNIGAAARALANTSAGSLWVVEPPGYDRSQAARLAAGADDVLEAMRQVRSLSEALDGCVDVVMTTGKPPAELPPPLDPEAAALRLLASPGPVALVFGDEVRGLPNRELRRAAALATVPTAAKSSLNLAQAVLVFGYEILLARRAAAPVPAPAQRVAAQEDEARADEALLSRLRARARAAGLSSGFLNPQQPDRVLEELLRLLRRAQPSRREVELLLAAADQVARRLGG